MPKITIGTDVVNFPDNGSDALWSPAVIQFAELVAQQLLFISNPYDISPTIFTITANSSPSNFIIGASFNGDYVRKFSLNYAIYRLTDTTSTTESGVLTGVYNTDDDAWTLQDEYFGDKKSDGTSYHSFTIDSQDRIILTTQQLAGILDEDLSQITFSAKTELVSI
jgi:hypothetical protein